MTFASVENVIPGSERPCRTHTGTGFFEGKLGGAWF